MRRDPRFVARMQEADPVPSEGWARISSSVFLASEDCSFHSTVQKALGDIRARALPVGELFGADGPKLLSIPASLGFVVNF